MTGVKATTWNWEEIQERYTADDNLYILSEREIGVLLTAIIPAAWRTRWFDRPADFELIEDFVGQLNDRLMTPVDLCALVAECIRNPDSPANAAVREISDSNNGYPPNQTPPSDQRNKDILSGTNPTCNLDKLYGQCDFVMTETNQFIVDFLERFEVTFNFSEVLAALAALPAINESGAETVAQYAQYIQEVLQENYAAQFTSELKREMTCGLFCIAKGTCSLTIAQIADYFAGLLGATLTPGDLLVDIVAALFGIPLSGNYVVYSLFTLVWKGLELTNIALDSVGDSVLTVALQAGAGEPSDDWMLFCDDCSTYWEEIVDFTGASMPTNWAISTLNTNMGEHIAGVGIRTKAQNFAQVGVKYTAPTAIAWSDAVDIEIKFDTVSGSITNGNRYLSTQNASSVVQQSATFANLTNTTGEQIVTASLSGDADLIKYAESVFGQRNTSGSGSIVMKQIKFSGTGVNPFA